MGNLMQHDAVLPDTAAEFGNPVADERGRKNHGIVERKPIFLYKTKEMRHIDVHADIRLRVFHAVKKLKMLPPGPFFKVDIFQFVFLLFHSFRLL
jgi:hypothetical protein